MAAFSSANEEYSEEERALYLERIATPDGEPAITYYTVQFCL
jgi:hypothetical protein